MKQNVKTLTYMEKKLLNNSGKRKFGKRKQVALEKKERPKCINATKPGFHAMPFLLLAIWQGFYSPIDPQINPYMCLDMTYPPTKFDID